MGFLKDIFGESSRSSLDGKWLQGERSPSNWKQFGENEDGDLFELATGSCYKSDRATHCVVRWIRHLSDGIAFEYLGLEIPDGKTDYINVLVIRIEDENGRVVMNDQWHITKGQRMYLEIADCEAYEAVVQPARNLAKLWGYTHPSPLVMCAVAKLKG
jgi:hypothetical protein